MIFHNYKYYDITTFYIMYFPNCPCPNHTSTTTSAGDSNQMGQLTSSHPHSFAVMSHLRPVPSQTKMAATSFTPVDIRPHLAESFTFC